MPVAERNKKENDVSAIVTPMGVLPSCYSPTWEKIKRSSIEAQAGNVAKQGKVKII